MTALGGTIGTGMSGFLSGGIRGFRAAAGSRVAVEAGTLELTGVALGVTALFFGEGVEILCWYRLGKSFRAVG